MKKILAILINIYGLTIHAQIITTVAGNATAGFSGDGGQAVAAKLNYPTAVAFDAIGNMYIADNGNNCVRKVNTTGIITTVAGNRTQGFSGDGGQATNAELVPFALTFDAEGNLYIADNLSFVVRKVATTGVITTVAGGGNCGNAFYCGDGGQATAAQLNGASGIVFDAAGNLYIADLGNECIRMVNTAGIINTIAGDNSTTYNGDGVQATAAGLCSPSGVAIDAVGNLYIVDKCNESIRIVNTAGIINTLAGNGTLGLSGDGGQATAAELYLPTSVAADAANNIYITQYNHPIRKVNTSGIINIIAGGGNCGSLDCGDGGQATAAEFNSPTGITIDVAGNLYIADGNNNNIRKVTNIAQAGIQQVTSNKQINIYPNPATNNFIIETNIPENQTLQVFDVNGKLVLTQPINGTTSIDAGILLQGVYNISLTGNTGVVNKRLVIVK